ncbi:MAG: universal stress protein [Acidobacteriota bacterium]|nr:MAG: universal stress protein [Acidobacteriota bacterium]
MPRWKTILAPVDFSEPSRHGVAMARDLALESRARLVLLHVVVDAVPAPLPDLGGFSYGELVRALEEQAKKELPEFFPEADRGGLADVSFRVELGMPHAEIARVAEEEAADLIVISTHGRTGAMHLLIGSVAERVVRTAGCPVLVVKKPG